MDIWIYDVQLRGTASGQGVKVTTFHVKGQGIKGMENNQNQLIRRLFNSLVGEDEG